jgi:hypothetical protein
MLCFALVFVTLSSIVGFKPFLLSLSQLSQAQNLSELAERTALRQCESLRSEAEIAKWLDALNGSISLCVMAFTAEWYATHYRCHSLPLQLQRPES